MNILNHLRSLIHITSIGAFIGLTLGFGSLTAQSIFHGGSNASTSCGGSLSITFASQGSFNQGQVTHNWYTAQTGGSGVTKTVKTNINGVYVTEKVVNSNVTYWVQPYVSGSPDGPRKSVSATFNSAPVASLQVNQLPTSNNPDKWLGVCNEGTMVFTASGATPIQWKRGSTVVQTGGTTYAPTQDGNYTFTASICGSTVSSNIAEVTFIQKKTPTVSISSNSGATVCSGSQVTYTANTNTNTALNYYSWSTGEAGTGASYASITRTITAGLTLSVTVNNADYCVTTNSVGSSNFTTNMHAIPQSQGESYGGGDVKICVGQNTGDMHIGFGNAVDGRTYHLYNATQPSVRLVMVNFNHVTNQPDTVGFGLHPVGNYLIKVSDSPCTVETQILTRSVSLYDPPTGALTAQGGMSFGGPVCLDQGAYLQAPTGKSGYEIHRVSDAGATDDIVSNTDTYTVDNILDVGVEGVADVQYYAKYIDSYQCSQSYQVTTPTTGFADVRQLKLPNSVGVTINTDVESGLVCEGGTAIFDAVTTGIEIVQSYDWTVDGVANSEHSSQLSVINMTGLVNVSVEVITTDCLDSSVGSITANSSHDIYFVPTLTVSNEPIEIFGAGNVTMVAGGTDSFTWHDAQGAQLEVGDLYSSYFNNTTSLKLKGTDENACLYEKDFDITLYPVPQLTLSGNNFLNDGTAPTLTLSNTTGISTLTWYQDGDVMSSQPGTTLNVTNAGSYKVVASTANGTFETPIVHISEWANAPSTNSGAQTVSEGAPATSTATVSNYVRSYTPIAEMFDYQETTLHLTNQLLSEDDAQISTQYIDGLGRGVQSVVRRGSPGGTDIIAPVVYDNLGRQPRSYLPYSGTQTTGEHLPNALQDQYNFYQPTATNSVADAKNPYASTLIENSPLGRVLEQSGPGESWYPGASWNESDRKTIKLNQRSNRLDLDGEIIIWQANGEVLEDSGSDYPENSLIVSEVKDEHDVRTLEFTNKSGQAILKRVQGDKNNWLDTYYVYDDFGNLIYVIPPLARKEIADGGFTAIGPVPDGFTRLNADQTYSSTQSAAQIYYDPGVKVTLGNGFSFTSNGSDQFRVVGGTLQEGLHYDLLFAYEYDSRQRMIAKKAPGAHWEYLVYDKWNRLVLTQNGNQRDNEEWSFIKYDADNRPAISGLVTLAGKDLATVRTEAAASGGRYVIKDVNQTTTWGYNVDNNTYPTIAAGDLLSVTYYDDYAYIDGSGWAGLGFYDDNGPSESYYATSNHTSVKGLVTGGASKLLDGSGNWLRNKIYYDNKYRPIQAQGENILLGSDRVTNAYDFSGNVTRSFQTHDPLGTTSTPDIEVTRIMAYDHGNRLLTVDHQVDDQSLVRLATYTYNELGELIEKDLHSEDNGSNYRQSIDYQYNIRGWLTAINDPDLTETGDLFGMKLNYDNGQNRLSFNGNISGVQWQTVVGGKKRTYGYVYDELNRIKMADFKAGTGWTEENGNHEMRVRQYDYNGNILDLERKDLPNVAGLMDDMDYSYQGNQLISVADAGDNTLGFKDGASTSQEYLYDHNGNMTVDQNKGINSITYNHLNLPEVVTISGRISSRIEYTYDASGTKLKQELYRDNVLETTSYYVGGFIYEQEGTDDKELRFAQTVEGRLVPWRVTDAIAGYEYQYHMTDHLGNVRLTFAGNNVAEVTATMESDPVDLKDFEEGVFRNLTATRQQVVTGLNHTPVDSYITNPNDAAYLEWTGVNSDEAVGPAMTFPVNTGDKVAMTVFAKFEDQSSFSTTALGSIGDELANAFQGLHGLETVQAAADAFNGAFTTISTYGGSSTQVPRAFLNYLLFDENHVIDKYGFIQIDEASGFAAGQATTVPFHDMYFTEPGGNPREVAVDKKATSTSMYLMKPREPRFGLTT